MDPLSTLGEKYRTDKAPWHHNYTPVYNSYLHHYRGERRLTLLEIGIGGYEYSDRGGESLKMWGDYFPMAHIVGIDIYDKSGITYPDYMRERIKTFIGSQTDVEFLANLITKIGNPNFIIDDGSHKNPDMIRTFTLLFPTLANGGIYFIEDTETSYWETEYLGSPDITDNHAHTVMNWFHTLSHYLNRHAFPHNKNNIMTELAEQISCISFFKNMIIIQKK